MIRRLLVSAVLALALVTMPALASQNTLVTPGAPLTMAQLATFLTNGFATVGSNYSGATPPAVFTGGTAQTGQYWLDTSTTPWVLRINDGAAWVAIGTLDATAHAFSAPTTQIPTTQTGTSYTATDGVRGGLVRLTNSGAIAVTQPQPGLSFTSGWWVDYRNAGTGTVTITSTLSTIDGAATLVLPPGRSVRIVSDGTNYVTDTTIGTPTTAVLGGVFSKAAVASNWLRSLGTDGILTASQPAFSDLSGSLACGQMPALTGDVTASAGGCVTVLANIPTGTPMAGSLLATNIVAPGTPASGKTSVYVDSTDKRLHDKNDAGTIGTTVVADTGTSNNFLTAISAAGVISKARPTCANLSDSVALCSSTDAAGLTGTVASARITGSYTGITGVGTLTAGATGAGFTVALATSTITGTLPCANHPALTGDVTTSNCAATLANIPSNVPMAGSLLATAIAAPSTPAAGKGSIYVDSTTKALSLKNDAGIVSITVVPDTGAANNYISAISAAGVITKSRPACATLSDSTSSCSTANATANTPSTLVARDGSGNFSAGTITAALTGNASTATALATARAIYGNNFDGTAALTQIIASTFGGTGNGFAKLSGPASTEKTFTLPNASAAILTDNAAVTIAQGGSGQATAIAARGASGFNIDACTSTGDANYAILAADRCIYHTALSAPRTDTLPAANAFNAGQILVINDFRGVASGSNTITLARAGSDTINGGTSALAVNSQYGWATYMSDGVSRWTFQAGSGGGGGVTGVTAGNGLDGGTITTSGTISAGYRRSFMLPL